MGSKVCAAQTFLQFHVWLLLLLFEEVDLLELVLVLLEFFLPAALLLLQSAADGCST